MYSRSLAADWHMFGIVALLLGACTYEPPTAAPTGGFAGSGGVGGASPCPGTQIRCNDVCTDTFIDPIHCGDCTTVCSPGFSCEAGTCQPSSICTPGEMVDCYSGPEGTAGVGACKIGKKTCAANGSNWGPCEGAVLPSTDTCDNLVDEDCNGSALKGADCLVSPNLVVRYFLDETTSGQAVTVMDSAPEPLHLPVTYDGNNSQPSYTSAGSGNGLEWNVADQSGVASISVKTTKVTSMLGGKKKGTIELVARVDGGTVNHTRLFAITTGTFNVISFGVYSTPVYVANLNDIEVGHWPADFGNLGRAVFHVVYDTTDTNIANRVRLYINGTLQAASGGTPPLQDVMLTFFDTESICLGNRDTLGRSFDGALYYAALYATALSETEIVTNAAALSAWDDK